MKYVNNIQSWWDDEEEEILLPEFCPCCGEEYDEIDYEYQICSNCGYNNNEENEN